MEVNILELIDFKKVDSLLEGFNKTTGFVTAILDLEGNVLSKSGWRRACTDFHRVNAETAERCRVSDTVLAEKKQGDKGIHFYTCLNGMTDVAVPVVIKGQHVANLFSGQFFFKEPDLGFFRKQALEFGFDTEDYIQSIREVPVLSEEKVNAAMDFLLKMTQLISDLAYQKMEQTELARIMTEREQRYRLLFESNPHPMWVYDLETLRFLEVNEVAVRKYGYSREEFLGLTLKDIRPEEDIVKLIENVKQIPDNLSFSGEWRHKNRNGDVFLVEIISHSILFNKRPARLVLANDITRRKIAEEELHKTNARLMKVLEVETVGVMFWNLETGNMTDANDTFLYMMGYSRDDISNQSLTWQKLTPPEYHEISQAEIDKFNISGHVGPYEKEYLCKDGSKKWLIFAGSSLGGNECVEFCVDISDRKAAEAALRQERDFSDAALESLPGVFYCYDTNFKFKRWNRNFETVTGYTGAEIKYMSPVDFFAGDDKKLLADRIREVFDKGFSSVEADFVAKDGTCTPYYFTGVSTEINGIKHLVGVGIDISVRKKAVDKMTEQLNELQRWHNLMLDREDRVLELKKEVNKLLEGRSQSPRYNTGEEDKL